VYILCLFNWHVEMGRGGWAEGRHTGAEGVVVVRSRYYTYVPWLHIWIHIYTLFSGKLHKCTRALHMWELFSLIACFTVWKSITCVVHYCVCWIRKHIDNTTEACWINLNASASADPGRPCTCVYTYMYPGYICVVSQTTTTPSAILDSNEPHIQVIIKKETGCKCVVYITSVEKVIWLYKDKSDAQCIGPYWMS
jgi:hypothetical protein